MILTENNCNRNLLIEGATKIEADCFSDSWSARSVEGQLMADGSVFFCSADEKGNVTGYVCGQILADECELYRIAVLDEYRGKGYAKELMTRFIEECRNNNIIGIFLEVRSNNLPARTLYEKYGFKNVGIRKNYYSAPTDDAVIYRCDI